MKTKMRFEIFRAEQFLLALMVAFLVLPGHATTLDDFNGAAKTGWSDFIVGPGLGSVTQTGGQFVIDVPGVGQQLFAASARTSPIFEVIPNRTVTCQVDLVSGNDPDAVAVLSWLPTGKDISKLQGYSLAVSSDRIVVAKGLSRYFYDGDAPSKSENITLSLSLTADDTRVVIEVKIIDRVTHAILFGQSFIDTAGIDVLARGTDSPPAPWTGPGNYVLMNFADQSSSPLPMYEVIFDNAAAFVTENVVLDDFNTAPKTGWTDFIVGAGLGSIVQSGGQLVIDVPGVGQQLFAACAKNSPIMSVVDGDRIDLSVDAVSGNDSDAVAVLAWLPTGKDLSKLQGYALAVSSSRIVVSKGLNKYFYDGDAPSKSDNLTLVLSLTGSGTSVLIDAKVLDKGNPGTPIFNQIFVDTAGIDVLATGTDSPAAPWTGPGNFVVMNFADQPSSPIPMYEVIFDNARGSLPPAEGNSPPVISNLQPDAYANFLPASTQISFKVSDDKPVIETNIVVVFNGTTYTSGSGLTISGAGNSRNVQLGGLTANVNCAVAINVTDSDGATTTNVLYFDTFLPTNLAIEVEDYNYGGGLFFDNPVPITEGTGPVSGSYASQEGMKEIDYHNDRADFRDNSYRPGDTTRMQHSLDFVRKKFSDAGGTAASVFDYDVADIQAGQWHDYTRTFAAGDYEVYLRESLFNAERAEAVLEVITGDPTQPSQTTQVLGSFFGAATGIKCRNIPLTAGTGRSNALVRLSGRQTLRLREVSGNPTDGGMAQNYLVFLPVAGSGRQRAIVSTASPANGAEVNTVTPTISVTIQNRDTAVKTNTIVLTLNHQVVTPAITGNSSGATVTYIIQPLPASGATNNARVTFKDSEDAGVTNDWSFVVTYLSLDSANRQSGPGLQRGFKVRVVQAPSGSSLANSLARAEDQLAPNSTIPVGMTNEVVAQTVNYNQSEGVSEFGPYDLVPGLDPAQNGTDDYAMEVQAYLELAAGAYRLGVTSDDGFKVSAGASLTDKEPILDFHNGGPASNQRVDFVVPVSGFYPFRMIWYNRGGAGYGIWFAENPVTSERLLLNDPNSPNAIKAYVTLATPPPIKVLFANRLGEAFAEDTSAQVNTSAKTITVARPSGNRFYRLSATSAYTVGPITISGDTLVFGYR